MQFDESSEKYRCCCECFHVKRAAVIIGVTECIVIFGILINSLVLLANVEQVTIGNETLIWGSSSALVLTPLIMSFVCIAVAFLAVCSLFMALTRRSPYFLIPHLFVQVIAVLLLLAAVIMGILAVSTDNIFFYRMLNAVDFLCPPSERTVALGTSDAVRIYIALIVYIILLPVELWFAWLIYTTYAYFKDRRSYMNYCFEYSTPMRTVHVRVPQYGTR